MLQISDKYSVQHILAYLKVNNINNIVLCPGSRNAPFIISLANDTFFNIQTIVDERTAGFVALGIVKSSKSPAVVICTSGSAVLNLAPAVLEAYYQELPLMVFTADRPINAINIGENQTFIQSNVYQNYIRYHSSIQENDSFENLETILSQVSNTIYNTSLLGPVHLNFHFTEPLYNTANQLKITLNKVNITNDNQSFELKIDKNKKVLIFLSTIDLSAETVSILNEISTTNNWVIISEITSNSTDVNFIHNIDLIIDKVPEIHYPEVIITSGGMMISKKIRTFLKKNPQIIHLDINQRLEEWNFFSNTYVKIQAHLGNDLHEIRESLGVSSKEYIDFWHSINQIAVEYQTNFFKKEVFSEFHSIQKILNFFSTNSTVYWGNSSIIRYANWSFWCQNKVYHCANRGVSGIEGVLATAVGSIMFSKAKTFCVLGDLSAMYESNSFWAASSLSNICIIVLNNKGGKIFSNIQPDMSPIVANLINTPHSFTLRNYAQMYDFEYIAIENLNNFNTAINAHLSKNGKQIIELIFNEDTYKYWNLYFEQFNQMNIG